MKAKALIGCLIIVIHLSGQQGTGNGPIFPLREKHVYSSGIVELPGGELQTRWFEEGGKRNSNDVDDGRSGKEVWITDSYNMEASREMPERGVCAHRGASATHPENTLAAFREAIRLGAHMIELDVRMTKDQQLVILHDETVDRTTDGKGKVADLTLEVIRQLDAGSWKSEKFKDERIPTFNEALAVMPENVWLNIHLKGGKAPGEKVAGIIVDENRTGQAILACGSEAAQGAREVFRDIMICNMDRLGTQEEYVRETIRMKCGFIQLRTDRTSDRFDSVIATLKQHQIRINSCCTDSPAEGESLFNSGVDFVLTDQLERMLKVSAFMGIEPLGTPADP